MLLSVAVLLPVATLLLLLLSVGTFSAPVQALPECPKTLYFRHVGIRNPWRRFLQLNAEGVIILLLLPFFFFL